MSTHPSASDWAKYDELLSAGTRGWNPLTRLPELLRNEYVWMGEFEFGFFSEEDIPERLTQGWVFLDTSHFDASKLNEVVGIRFGLTDTDGHIKFRDNYIMIQPKDFRKKLVRRRNEESEAMHKAQTSGQKYIAPGDVNGDSESEYVEEARFTVRADQAKPGRPKKN